MARYGFLSFRSADSNGLYTFPFPFLPAGHPPFSIPAFPPHSAVRPPGELFCCKSNRQSQPLPMPASRRRGEPGKSSSPLSSVFSRPALAGCSCRLFGAEKYFPAAANRPNRGKIKKGNGRTNHLATKHFLLCYMYTLSDASAKTAR